MPGVNASPASSVKKGLSPAGSESELTQAATLDGTQGYEESVWEDGFSRAHSKLQEDAVEDRDEHVGADEEDERTATRIEKTFANKGFDAVAEEANEPLSDAEEGATSQHVFAAGEELMALPRPAMRKLPVSSAEERLSELLHKRLFGHDPQPACPASRYGQKAVPASGRTSGHWSTIKPNDEENLTFQPAVLQKSKELADYRNTWFGYDETQEYEEWTPLSAHDRLYQDHPREEAKKVARRQVLQVELEQECSFQPVISKQSKFITASKEVEGNKEWWDILSNPKKKHERKEETPQVVDSPKSKAQEEKKAKEQKMENRWKVHHHKRSTHKWLPPQDASFNPDTHTFMPQFNAHPKYLGPSKPQRITESRKKRAGVHSLEGSTFVDTIPLHDRVQPDEFHPAFDTKIFDDIYHRSRLRGQQTNPSSRPYHRPYLAGQYPFSRQNHALAQNMQLEGDPVFNDLHNMLHSMQL